MSAEGPTVCLMLGQDHPEYGHVAQGRLGDDIGCALSVGSDPTSPSTAFKSDPDVPNEDALLAMAQGPWRLLAVADAHFGPTASHALLQAMAGWSEIPTTGEALLAGIGIALAQPGPEVLALAGHSATTLVAAVIHVETGVGAGVSIGDSSAVALGPTGARRLNPKTDHYASPGQPEVASMTHHFAVEVPPGEALVLFTDGIDECHYRTPEKSIDLSHIEEIGHRARFKPRLIARTLAVRALNGVGDHPGGQDNLAVVAWSRPA